MPNEKYEDEIRDILNRMNEFIPEDKQRSRPRRRQQPPPWSGWMASLRRQFYSYNSTSFMVGFILFALAAAILQKIYPPFAMMAALVSVACLLAAIVLPMTSRRYGPTEHRWRGRIIDLEQRRMRRPFSWRYAWWRIKTFFHLR